MVALSSLHFKFVIALYGACIALQWVPMVHAQLRSGLDNTAKSRSVLTQNGKENDIRPNISVIAAFSENHFLEGVTMLRSLTMTNYTGPLIIYVLRSHDEPTTKDIVSEFKREIASHTTLNAQVIEYELWTPFSMYCFKPTVIQDYLTNAGLDGKLPRVMMWADTSTRFHSNPEDWAKAMLDDGVDFSIGLGGLDIVKGTHDATFEYLGKNQKDFEGKTELRSGHFLVNLDGPAEKGILRPWLQCGTRACEECMAPRGSVKWPISSPNLHRQDQSVLGVLTYDFMKNNPGHVAIGGHEHITEHTQKYLDLYVERDSHAKSLQCLWDDSECF